jgi:hypothetical protein
VSTSRLKIPEAYRALARTALRLGWTISRHGSGHLRWLSPSGAVITTAGSPSDRRSIRNDRARLRRAGLTERKLRA